MLVFKRWMAVAILVTGVSTIHAEVITAVGGESTDFRDPARSAFRPSFFWTPFTGNSVPNTYSFNPGTITLDTATGAVTYSGLSENFGTTGQVTSNRVGSVFVGLNQVDFRLSNTLNPFTLFQQVADVSTTVTSSTSTTADTGGVPLSQLRQVETAFTGSFTITGPTETVQGDYSVPITFPTTGPNVFDRLEIKRDSMGNVIQMRVTETISLDVTPTTIFSGTVDGVQMEFGANGGADFVTHMSSTATAIPEPGTLLASCFALTAGWIWRRRGTVLNARA